MATRKRATRRSGLVGRAVSAGRQALKEAESRIPPDLRKRVDRGIKDADKAARAAIKQLQVQVKRASTRADVNSVLKRIDGLTRQARQIARATGPAKAAKPRPRAAATNRKAAPRKAAPGKSKAASTTRRRATSTARRTSTGSTASRPRRAVARRSPTRRARATEAAMPEVVIEPEAIGEIEVLEITEA